jgi:hypothetical protein
MTDKLKPCPAEFQQPLNAMMSLHGAAVGMAVASFN